VTSASFGTQLRLLARRSVLRTFRDAGNVAPAIVVPLVLFAVVAAGLQSATNIPDFPTDSFVTFALTIAFAQGAMVTIANSGQAVATDIETGFLNRLALTPMKAAALLSSQLSGAVALGVLQAVVFFGVGFAAGANVEAGAAGAIVLAALFLLAVAGFSAFGIFIGLRTASGQAVQAIAPLGTVFLFLSSANFPRNLIERDWFRWIANVNPLSYLVEGMRSLLITGWDVQALALGFTVPIVLIAVTLALSAFTLRTRLVRT
jgi:ABC-2 type transport system permease protein